MISPVIFVFLALAASSAIVTVLGDDETLPAAAAAAQPVQTKPKPRGFV
jgi:hypothetical protein